MEEEDEDDYVDEEWEEGDTECTETSTPTSDYRFAAPHPGNFLVRRRSITDLVIVSPSHLDTLSRLRQV